MSPVTATTAGLIREWVSAADRAAGPKPMALPFLSAGDPEALARIALSTIHEGILVGNMGLARLAVIVGATAEHEVGSGGHRGPGWGTQAQVRVGLALIDCAMRAAEWLILGAGPGGRLVVSVVPCAMDAARHCLGSGAPDAEGWRPTVWPLAPPFGTIRTLIGGRSVTLALAEVSTGSAAGRRT